MMEGPKRTRMMLKNNLPRDTFMDILSRLPTKSLCRFRCVSIQWCNTISDPNFVKLYNDQSTQKRDIPLLLFYDRDPRDNPAADDCSCTGCCMDYEEDYDESYPEDRPTYKIETSHYLITTAVEGDGRVCDKLNFWHFEGNTDDVTVIPSGHELVFLMRGIGDIYICNPSTHEQVELPWPCGNSVEKEGRFALTFVPSTGDYKLLHLIEGMDYDDITMETSCRVYDITKGGKSGAGKWRCLYSCRKFPNYYSDPWLLNVVSNIDGAVYWWMKFSDHNYIARERKFERIISLDLEKDEDFLIIEKPTECSHPFSSSVYLVGLKGQLSLIHVTVDGTFVIDIWMLKDPRNSTWAKECSLKIPFKKFYSIMPLHIGERDVLLQILFRNSISVLRRYRLGRKYGRDLPAADYKTGPFIYTGGLFPLGRSQI